MKKFFLTVAAILCLGVSVHAETAWKSIGSDINCREFNCVAVDVRNPEVIYAGTSNGAYKTEDGGLSWRQIFKGLGGRKNVRNICITDDEVYLCTDRGLLVSRNNGKNWHPSFGMASRSRIYSVAVLGEDLFIATYDGVFKTSKDKKKWRRVFSSVRDRIEDIDKIEDIEISPPEARTVAASFKHPSRIYVGTRDGIYVSDDKGGSFKRFTDEGLLDKRIDFVIESPLEDDELYAVTKTGIFYFDDGWHCFDLTESLQDARSIAFDLDPENSIWVATKRGAYKSVNVSKDEEKAEVETSNLLSNFRNEPTIEAVQEKAINYAEVHPDKISSWRRRASVSAILPRLSFGIDKDEADTYEIYTSSTKQYSINGPRKSSDGWDVTLTWDLGDLIWNNAQTSIDVRSKLMVQLRDDILDEVTSYYFERRRLQVELLEAPPKNKRDRVKKELRVQELTANIDALTGGYFSREIK